MPDPLQHLTADQQLDLPAGANFRAATHLWSRPEINALRLALAARRPLLLRGEPGSGKSQLARAAAWALYQGQPLVAVVHPRFEASELLYSFDAMARLMDAQLGDKGGWDSSNEKYLSPGVLWRAFELSGQGTHQPVVLIDEIDKADADVPNSLLDVLANRSFEVPMRKKGQRIQADDAYAPLILFTTNEERELPAAFVRRCVVLNLNPPKDNAALQSWLVQRVQAHADADAKGHGGRAVSAEVVQQVVRQTLADRKAVLAQGYPPVGLAEAIDLLHALQALAGDPAAPQAERTAKQLEWLQELSAFALIKHDLAAPGQGRAPLPPLGQTAEGSASAPPAAGRA
jgi:MoxR-like ATPase